VLNTPVGRNVHTLLLPTEENSETCRTVAFSSFQYEETMPSTKRTAAESKKTEGPDDDDGAQTKNENEGSSEKIDAKNSEKKLKKACSDIPPFDGNEVVPFESCLGSWVVVHDCKR